MAVECQACGHAAEVVAFRRPPKGNRNVRILWLLILVAGITTVVNSFQAAVSIFPLDDQAQLLRGSMESLSSGTLQEEMVTDLARLASNVISLITFMLLIVTFYLPVRYGLILWRYRHAAPSTLVQVRNVARQSLAVAGLLMFVWIMVFSDLRTVSVSPPWTLNLLLAPLILHWSKRADVRVHFSHYEVFDLRRKRLVGSRRALFIAQDPTARAPDAAAVTVLLREATPPPMQALPNSPTLVPTMPEGAP